MYCTALCPTLSVTYHRTALPCPSHIICMYCPMPYPVRYISSVCTVVPYPERMIASFQHFPLTATTKYPVTRQARNHVGSHIICTVRYSGVQCSTVQYSTVQYSVIYLTSCTHSYTDQISKLFLLFWRPKIIIHQLNAKVTKRKRKRKEKKKRPLGSRRHLTQIF